MLKMVTGEVVQASQPTVSLNLPGQYEIQVATHLNLVQLQAFCWDVVRYLRILDQSSEDNTERWPTATARPELPCCSGIRFVSKIFIICIYYIYIINVCWIFIKDFYFEKRFVISVECISCTIVYIYFLRALKWPLPSPTTWVVQHIYLCQSAFYFFNRRAAVIFKSQNVFIECCLFFLPNHIKN